MNFLSVVIKSSTLVKEVHAHYLLCFIILISNYLSCVELYKIVFICAYLNNANVEKSLHLYINLPYKTIWH